MKTFCLLLCVGLALAVVPCRAQQPVPTGVVEGLATPLMLVYVAKPDENILPRIALGLEKPAVKIMAFEKCVRIFANPQQSAEIAAQLQAEDTRALVAAIKALGAPDARELPNVIIWFATPDNKALNSNPSATNGTEANLIKGVLLFDPRYDEPVVRYLTAKLHPE